ncbi:MAG: mannose-1-phosphate guanylyltransferase [Bacteroidota bacterium]
MKKAAVIMAGGKGTKLWPRSTEDKPKQFIHLIGDGTMIQNTFTRIREVFDIEDIYVVIYRELYNLVIEQLPELNRDNIILEPFGRNTAPALILTYLQLKQNYGPDDIMLAFPADHVIINEGEFFNRIETAAITASETNGLVTLGIEPTRPETQFGYVQIDEYDSEGLGTLFDAGVRKSRIFAEKPDAGTAQRFLQSGDFLWNSGIFIWKMDTFAKAYKKYMPDHADVFTPLENKVENEDFFSDIESAYRKIDPISIDYGILEKATNVYVVKSFFNWSDVGTWDELYRLSMKDPKNNVVEGDVITIKTTNSLISANSKFIAAVGVSDLIVIDSEDAVFICKRGDSESIQEAIDFMRRKHINKL